MFWKKKKPRSFEIYVADPSPIWITVSVANYGEDVMRISHYELHSVIGFIESAIATKNKSFALDWFQDKSITILEMMMILPLLKQAVFTARGKLSERERHQI